MFHDSFVMNEYVCVSDIETQRHVEIKRHRNTETIDETEKGHISTLCVP